MTTDPVVPGERARDLSTSSDGDSTQLPPDDQREAPAEFADGGLDDRQQDATAEASRKRGLPGSDG